MGVLERLIGGSAYIFSGAFAISAPLSDRSLDTFLLEI